MQRIRYWLCLLALLLSACTSPPRGVEPVQGFELERYLGTWYEIARLDHRFERGLTRVEAQYQRRKDGGVDVVNRGFAEETQEWRQANGRAYFVSEPDTGHLKVSFFGPFYGAYVIFELDKQGYQYAFVSGYSRDYLWLLSRTPTVDDKLLQRFLASAKHNGFDIDELIFNTPPITDSD